MAVQRIALVIGNSAYENSSPLKNPVNDAALITRALLQRGFEVIGGASTPAIETGLTAGMNLKSMALGMTFAQFKGRIEKGATVVIYYAGHGVQVGDKNYLVPVDDSLDPSLKDLGLIDIKAEMETLTSLVGEGGNVVLFLDACRNGPLSDKQKRNLLGLLQKQEEEERRRGGQVAADEGGRNLNVGSTRGRLGTFKMQLGEGCGRTFIGFATAPGDVAQDGLSGNSDFAIALDKHLAVRGLHIEDLFDRVAKDVLAVVRKTYDGTIQDPWSETNCNDRLYLHPRDPSAIWKLGIAGLAAGLFICLTVFKGGHIINSVPPYAWFTGLAFGIVIALGTMHWGSGRKKYRDIILALIGPGIGFALALAILQVLPGLQTSFASAELTGERALASGVYKTVVVLGGVIYLIGTWMVRYEKQEPPPQTWLGVLNRVLTWLFPFVIVGVLWRLETYMSGASPEQTAMAMFAVLGGVIYAGSIPLALRAQGGLFAQFGPFTGAITIGLLMAAFFGMYEMIKYTWGFADTDLQARQIVLVALGTAWHGLLGAQIGYCFAYYVPDHKVPV